MNLHRLGLLSVGVLLAFTASSFGGLDPRRVTRMVDSGVDYPKLDAQSKVKALWNEISRIPYDKDECPSVIFGNIPFLVESYRAYRDSGLTRAIERKGPEFPPEELPKHKLFHTYGTAAIVEFVPHVFNPPRYTGILAEKVHGIARWSQAGPIFPGVGWVPAVGLKFPRDYDAPDGDLLAMNGLDPIASGVFRQPMFEEKHPFTNVLPLPVNPVLRYVAHRFSGVMEDGQATNQPVDQLTFSGISGTEIENPKTPYRLVLVGTVEARQVYKDREDFREAMKAIPVNTPLYTIYALNDSEEAASEERVRDKPKYGREIGTLYLRTQTVASFYGDHVLHISHNGKFQRKKP